MTDEDFHRLEHKVDELISYLRNSSLARQGDREAFNSVANFVPTQPNEERPCPVCNHIVSITQEPKFDPISKSLLAPGLKRNCNCKVITIR